MMCTSELHEQGKHTYFECRWLAKRSETRSEECSQCLALFTVSICQDFFSARSKLMPKLKTWGWAFILPRHRIMCFFPACCVLSATLQFYLSKVAIAGAQKGNGVVVDDFSCYSRDPVSTVLFDGCGRHRHCPVYGMVVPQQFIFFLWYSTGITRRTWWLWNSVHNYTIISLPPKKTGSDASNTIIFDGDFNDGICECYQVGTKFKHPPPPNFRTYQR